MQPRIIISADNLNDEDVALIRQAADGWGSVMRVPQDTPQARDAIFGADVVVGWADAPLLRQSRASIYLCGSAGIDAYMGHGLDTRTGFRMANAAHTMSVTIAEHCIAMMLALVRQLPDLVRQQTDRRFVRRWHGGEITGASACIVGLGNSGKELAKRLTALGMSVTGVRRSCNEPVPCVDRIFAPHQIHEAIAHVHHVFCLLPGGAATRHLFNSQAFSAMRKGTWFYNASRGSTVDEAALIVALRTHHLAGAGLDVIEREPLDPSSPLWTMPHVLLTGHSAGHSNLLSSRLASLFAENLTNLRHERPLRNEVNTQLLRQRCHAFIRAQVDAAADFR